jgi:signal transduction histidine kinase
MSRGIYPRVLADRGLRPALQSAVAASAVPVMVGVGDPGRLPMAVEAALYFCALEAVQNATKHAAADLVTVDLGQDEASWRLQVSDDGTGFDFPQVAACGGGSGLLNMTDRLSAVGGSVCVTSRLGAGTTVTALVARTATPAQAVPGPLVLRAP